MVTSGIIESCSYDFALSDIIIPATLDAQSVTGISSSASITSGVFYNKGITSLVLPATLTTIGNCAFNTNKITVLDISSCTLLNTIGSSAFYSNNIASLGLSTCPALKIIDESAFIWNDISTLNFTNCNKLSSIGEYAFANSALTSLDLSACTALTSIGANAFYNNHNEDYTIYLTGFNLPTPNIPGYKLAYWEDGNATQYAGGALISDLTTSYTANLVEAYNVTFTVTDGTNPISGATVSLTGYGNVITNTLGVALFTNVSSENNIPYTVSATAFTTENSTISVLNADVNKTVTLTAITEYTLTDTDVVVTDGIIQSCSYDFAIKGIIIPETLDGQTVTGIRDGGYSDGVFYNKGIKTVVLPATLLSIGNYAFRGNAITDVTFPASLSSIGDAAFENNKLTSIDLSVCSSLKDIGLYAFYGNALTDVTFPASLSSIGDAAFDNNKLTSIDLSVCSSLKDIGLDAFSNNSGLSSLTLPTPNYTGLQYWIDANGTQYAAGSTVNDLGTFYHAYIPYTLTDNDVVVTDSIIQSCSYDFILKDIIIPETLDGQTVTGIRDVDNYSDGVFYNKGIKTVVLPATFLSIGSHAFHSNSLTSIDLSVCGSLKNIGFEAFISNALTSVTLPASLSSIGDYAFGSNKLTSIDLSVCSSLKDIGVGAFSDNSGLSSLTLPTPNYTGFLYWIDANAKQYAAGTTVSDFGTFYHAVIPYTLTDADVVVTDGVIQSCSYDFTLKDIIIPETLDGQTVTGIRDLNNYSDGVFYNKGIKTVVLPASLLSIGRKAFNSNSLISIDLSVCNSLTIIKHEAFRSNVLTSVKLPASLSSIGNYAFDSNKLTSIDLSVCSSLKYIRTGAFYRNALTDIKLPSSLSSIGNYAFESNKLTSIDLSVCSSLTYIGQDAFSNNSLSEMELPNTFISGYQFNYWLAGDNTKHAGGESVSNFATSYTANLTGALNVRFTVSDGTKTLEGASISFGSYGTSTTDASGIAVFTEVAPGNNIAYTVALANYNDFTDTISVVDSDISKEVVLTVVTGFSKLTHNSKIKLYPNPATDMLYIANDLDDEIINITIYNFQGKRILSKEFSNQKNIELNVSALKSGNYLLKCTTRKNNIISKKIIKK